MALRNNMITKVITGSTIAIYILSQTLNGFALENLKNPDQYFNQFGSEKSAVIEYVNRTLIGTPDIAVLGYTDTTISEVSRVLSASDNAVAYTNTTKPLTDAELTAEINRLGIDTTKRIAEFTPSEIDSLVKLVPRRFSDVRGDEWYVRDLAVLMAKGIVLGSNGKFNPASDITRSEFYALWSRCIKNPTLAEVNRKWSEQELKNYLCTGSRYNEALEADWVLFTRNPRYMGLKDTWYAKYIKDITAIPFGRYVKPQFEMAIRRGEAAHALFFELNVKEMTTSERDRLTGMKFFTDTPSLSNIMTMAEAQTNKMLAKFSKDTDSSSGFYYPDFENVVNGKEKMLESTLTSINGLNKQGIMVGNNGKSAWNSKITRAETIAILVRAFNKSQRLPESKRTPEIGSSTTKPAPSTTPPAGLVDDSGAQAITSPSTNKKSPSDYPYRDTWSEFEKRMWFESMLGFQMELDTYETDIKAHVAQWGISTNGEVSTVLDRWYTYLKNELSVLPNNIGLPKYYKLCQTMGYSLGKENIYNYAP